MLDLSRPQKWLKLGSESGPTLPMMRVRYDRLQNPRTRKEKQVLVLDTYDWANIVAVTPEQKIVVVRQYRFGTEEVSTEIPGGLIDPGEDSQTAAMRELREETGFTSEDWHYLGPVAPNPAFLSNTCHQWLAKDAQQTEVMAQDEGEDIIVATLTLEQLGQEILTGHFNHSLALLALAHVFDLREIIGSHYGV